MGGTFGFHSAFPELFFLLVALFELPLLELRILTGLVASFMSIPNIAAALALGFGVRFALLREVPRFDGMTISQPLGLSQF